jgi:hypothetical protein
VVVWVVRFSTHPGAGFCLCAGSTSVQSQSQLAVFGRVFDVDNWIGILDLDTLS